MAGLFYEFILVPLNITFLKTIVFILVIAALVQFVELFLKKYMKSLYQALGVFLPLITTNCAVLGVALTNVQKEYGIVTGIVNGFATAVGFTISIVILAGIREKMEYNDEIFYVFISGLYQNTDGIDNYQINEVEDAINEKLHDMVPDMIHMDCYLGNMKVSPDDSYYGMMSLKYDGNNLKEVLEDMQMSQIIVSLANSDM